MSDTDSKNFEITNSNSPMMESGDEDDFVLVKVRPPLPLLYPKLPTTTTHNHQSERKNEEVGLEHKIPNSIERDGQQKKLLTPMNHRKSITKVILAACILTTVLTVVTNRFGKVLKPSGLIIPLTSYVTNVMVRTKAPPIRQLPNIQHSNNIRSSTCERIQPILLLHPVRWPLISAFSSSQEQRIELERPMVGPLVHSGWFPRRPSSSPPHFKPLAKVVTSLVQKGWKRIAVNPKSPERLVPLPLLLMQWFLRLVASIRANSHPYYQLVMARMETLKALIDSDHWKIWVNFPRQEEMMVLPSSCLSIFKNYLFKAKSIWNNRKQSLKSTLLL